MKGLKPFPLLVLAVLACFIELGCQAKAPTSGPGALNIYNSGLNAGVVNLPYSDTLYADGGTAPYTWTLNSGTLPPGLTLSSGGVISGTPSVVSGTTYPATYNVTVQVTDSQTPTAAAQTLASSIVINPALTLASLTLQTGNVNVGYNTAVAATGGLTPYTYCVLENGVCDTGTNGALPPGLSLVETDQQNGGAVGGTITGIPTAAGTFPFTIQVTDSANETTTGTFTITITGRLQGSFVLNLDGYSQVYNGQPFHLEGMISADGNGNITAGEMDQTGPAGTLITAAPVTGTYTIPASSNFGTLTLNINASTPETLNFNFLVSTTGNSPLIESDSGNVWGSGYLKKQTATALPSSNTVNYAYGFYGSDPSGSRYAGAGALAAAAGGAISGGEQDTNDNGTLDSKVSITGGNLLSTPTDSMGRGVATITTASGTSTYAYYVVSTSEFDGINIDAGGPATAIQFLEQGAAGSTGGGSFTNASLNGQAILQLSALTSAAPDISVGVASFDGAGTISRTDSAPGYYLDEDAGGTVTSISYTTAHYSVDASCGSTDSSACGRVTVSNVGTGAQPVWYLSGKNQGFVVGTDASVTQGSFVQQTAPATGFTIANIIGSYNAATVAPVTSQVTNYASLALTPPPGGIWEMIYNSNGPLGAQSSQSFYGTYDCNMPASPPLACSTLGTSLGRFEVTTTTTPGSQQILILYVLGGGATGSTGGKSGLIGVNTGTFGGQPDNDPKLVTFGH